MLGQVRVAHQGTEGLDDAVDQAACGTAGDAVGLHGAADMVQRIAQVVHVRRLAGLGLRRLAGIGVHVDDLVSGAGCKIGPLAPPANRFLFYAHATRIRHPRRTHKCIL
ncbi:hypothetical protein D9M72_553600 [compost metagenome]